MNDDLEKDIKELKRRLGASFTKKNVTQMMSDYYLLMKLYGSIHGGYKKDMVISDKDLDRISKLCIPANVKLNKYIDVCEENKDIFYDIASNYVKIIEEMGLYVLYLPDKYKRYNAEEYAGLLFDFFQQYGYDQLLCDYFTNDRVISFESDKQSDGEFFSGRILKSGYIKSESRHMDSSSLGVVAHEMGHAIDAKEFLFPQQKDFSFFTDIFLEVTSSTYETLFYDYLVDNRIDETGGLLLKNLFVDALRIRLNTIKNAYSFEEYYYDEDGDVINLADHMGYTEFRSAIIYAVGGVLAYHFDMLFKEEPKEAKKLLMNLVTSSKEVTNVEEVVKRMGLDVNKFVSGEYVKDKLESDQMRLQKKIQRY